MDIVSGRRQGLHYDLVLAALAGASLPYRLAIAVRNTWYDKVAGSRRKAAVPVISIGNITVGGTGKTPMTSRVAELLHAAGRKVAILTRGYKAPTRSAGKDAQKPSNAPLPDSDEAMLLRRRCPFASVVVDPDRLRGARSAVDRGADVLVLDDGFQHRRLARDLDIVLIDATRPFGFGWLLPRGLLREPIGSLGRADLIVLTRSDQIESSDRRLLLTRLKRASGQRPIVEAFHRLTGFADVNDDPVQIDDPRAIQAVLFAGVANFRSFVESTRAMGAAVLAAYEYPDHHDYTDDELVALQDVAATLEANAVLTTEKDAVKLAGRWKETACRLLVPKLEIGFEPEGEKVLRGAIEPIVARRS